MHSFALFWNRIPKTRKTVGRKEPGPDNHGKKWPGEAHKQPQLATQYFRAKDEECLRIRNKVLTGDFQFNSMWEACECRWSTNKIQWFPFFWFPDTRVSFCLFPDVQNTSVMFQGVCSSFMVLSWLDKKPTRERREVPTDLRGGLTESKLSKSRKFGEKAAADGPQENQKYETTFCRTLRRRQKWKQNCTRTYQNSKLNFCLKIAKTNCQILLTLSKWH